VHSWWIPALGGKIDAIPGTVNTTWFRAKRPGVFPGQCAELCGLYHAKMTAAVEVMPAAEFDAWLAERATQQAAGTSPLGEELWEGSCAKCHGLDGEGGYGPRVAGSTLLQDPDALAKLLHEGGRLLMPPVGREWGEDEMRAIRAYLEENLGG
jgi:cytochrome c oxidase subunit 2